jgi:hypothetical protein
MYFTFCRLSPLSSTPSHHASVWVLPVISLLLTDTMSPVRGLVYPYDWRGFVRGTQKEDECVLLSIQSSLHGCTTETLYWFTATGQLNTPYKISKYGLEYYLLSSPGSEEEFWWWGYFLPVLLRAGAVHFRHSPLLLLLHPSQPTNARITTCSPPHLTIFFLVLVRNNYL